MPRYVDGFVIPVPKRSAAAYRSRYVATDGLLALLSDDRRVLVWCGLEGAAAPEVALRLGISVAAVTKRWQRLRARLAASAWVKTLLLSEA